MTYQPPKEEMAALLRMVEVQASSVGRGAPDVRRDELIAEGNLALVLALRRFDPAGPASAWTFSEPRVRGAMLDYVRVQHRPGMGKRNKGPAYVFEEVSDDLPDAAGSGGATIDAAAALAVLTDPVERAVVVGRMEGVSYEKLAIETGLNRRKLQRIYGNALEKIRAELGVRTGI